MKSNNIFAHSANKNGKWQELSEHLYNVAEESSKFAECFGSAQWAYNIGLLHDMGKASKAFQEYLTKAPLIDSDEDGICISRTNHSGAGAVFSIKKYANIGKIFAYCVAGHHAGLADWYGGASSLSYRIGEKGDSQYIDLQVKEYFESINLIVKENLYPPNLKNPKQDLHLWIRMLYSCLVDADFLDTEKFLDEEKHNERSKYDDVNNLANKFFIFMEDKIKNAKKTNLNKIRKEIFDNCVKAASKKSGFFELTVPTGGGKTLSAVAFAFKHAKNFVKSRIIYVIPYTSIIEQTSKILKDILGNENVIEHHSNIDPDKETERSRLACENWDAPIIVTTNVQFFESLYANKSSKCRKLHNIANSIIILDEAQMLPTELLYPIEDVLRQLVNNYKCSVVFSTATQPYFQNIKPVEKIIPNSMDLYNKLKRVNYNFPQKDSKNETWEEISDKLKKYNQALCVVNTRKDCYDLYKLMPKGTVHLSALMCAAHRSRKIAEIKEKLKNKEDIRVISTQLIEAGVDIDFPVVFRAFAGLPSIIQSAGRCNREGNLERGEVFVFNAPRALPIGLMRKSGDSTKEMMYCCNLDVDNHETAKRFFELLLSKANSIGDKELKDKLVNEAISGNFQFKTYAQIFSIIEDKCNKSIIVRYDEKSKKLLETLKFTGISKNLTRALQRYTVNIPENVFKDIKAKGLIEEIADNIFSQGDFIYNGRDKLYSEETGLNIYEIDSPQSYIL